jgi:hypothetical protein
MIIINGDVNFVEDHSWHSRFLHNPCCVSWGFDGSISCYWGHWFNFHTFVKCVYTFETLMPIFPPLHSKPPPTLMVINKMLGLTTKRPLHWSSNGQQCAFLFPLLHKRVAYAPYGCQIGFPKQQYFGSSLQTTP